MSLLWDLSDVLMGVMALINIPVILILSGIAFKAIQDYEVQLKQGSNPVLKVQTSVLDKKQISGDKDCMSLHSPIYK